MFVIILVVLILLIILIVYFTLDDITYDENEDIYIISLNILIINQKIKENKNIHKYINRIMKSYNRLLCKLTNQDNKKCKYKIKKYKKILKNDDEIIKLYKIIRMIKFFIIKNKHIWYFPEYIIDECNQILKYIEKEKLVQCVYFNKSIKFDSAEKIDLLSTQMLLSKNNIHVKY